MGHCRIVVDWVIASAEALIGELKIELTFCDLLPRFVTIWLDIHHVSMTTFSGVFVRKEEIRTDHDQISAARNRLVSKQLFKYLNHNSSLVLLNACKLHTS